MARDELPREDLLAEAKALVSRIELRVPGLADSLVVGFRKSGAASFFFEQDPAYHFNSRHELRRAYALGSLYKAERGKLIRLTRQRSADETALVRYELTAREHEEFLAAAHGRLQLLLTALEKNQAQVVGIAAADGDIIARVTAWLAERGPSFTVAVRPHAD